MFDGRGGCRLACEPWGSASVECRRRKLRRRGAEGAADSGSGRRPLAVVLAAGAVAIHFFARRPPRTDEEARARIAALRAGAPDLNVVVVTLDTTRADRLGCYGFSGGGTTPHLDALARDGVVFENATADRAPDLPLALVDVHRPHPAAPRRARQRRLLPGRGAHVTLAERLQAAGYATGAFIGAWVLESRWGLGQGFDDYSDRFEL